MDYSKNTKDITVYFNHLHIGGIIDYQIDKTYVKNPLTNEDEPQFSVTLQMLMVSDTNKLTFDFYEEQPVTISIVRNGYGINFPILKINEIHETIKEDRMVYITINCIGNDYSVYEP